MLRASFLCMSELPERKRPPHHPAVELFNRSVIIFLTICTSGRRSWLGCDAAHAAFKKASSAATHWQVGRYILMPNHIHLFCSPGTAPPEPVARWVSYWKRQFTLEICKTIPGFKWQRDFWDTQLRSGDSYSEKWAYVQNNPVRAGLLENSESWPYQGELNSLQWHD